MRETSATVVDEGEWGFDHVSVAVDAAGSPHVSYFHGYGGELRYATSQSDVWKVDVVDTNLGALAVRSALTIDIEGGPHIAYYDPESDRLIYAHKDAGTWLKTEVDATAELCWFDSIAIDGAGSCHIAYMTRSAHETTKLVYGTNRDGSWKIETLVEARGSSYSASIAIDEAGRLHIVYDDPENGVCYGTNASGAWSFEPLDEMPVHSVRMSLDTQRNVHVTFEVSRGIYPGNTLLALQYATNASGAWETTTVEELTVAQTQTVGWTYGVATDERGNAYLAYSNEHDPGRVILATNRSGDWSTKGVADDLSDLGVPVDLAIDDQGRVLVVYSNKRAETLEAMWWEE